MSTETERRVENLLGSSGGSVSVNNSSGASSQIAQKSSLADIVKPVLSLQNDTTKERQHIELQQRQEHLKVHILIWLIPMMI